MRLCMRVYMSRVFAGLFNSSIILLRGFFLTIAEMEKGRAFEFYCYNAAELWRLSLKRRKTGGGGGGKKERNACLTPNITHFGMFQEGKNAIAPCVVCMYVCVVPS